MQRLRTLSLTFLLIVFLAWSPRFAYLDTNYKAQGTSRIYDNTDAYGTPTWAYEIAEKVVKGPWNPKDPYGGMNTQTKDEQQHFLAAYEQYGKFNTEKEGIYYMWGQLDGKISGNMVVLTWDQQKYHCGLGKYRCGN